MMRFATPRATATLTSCNRCGLGWGEEVGLGWEGCAGVCVRGGRGVSVLRGFVGRSINDALRNSKGYRNPDFMQQVGMRWVGGGEGCDCVGRTRRVVTVALLDSKGNCNGLFVPLSTSHWPLALPFSLFLSLQVVKHEGIDEHGSCFSKDVFNPHGFDRLDYYDALVAEQRREMERKEQERRQKGGQIEFQRGGTVVQLIAAPPK
ncbi:unnamed protein product, partial [Closterium sp. NIES-54]